MTNDGIYKRKPDNQSRYSSKVSIGGHVYYPQEYFKRVGYEPSEAASVVTTDALGQRVRERFNE